jgi:[ribosomal protein S18]-alanine N-acetyltransferase
VPEPIRHPNNPVSTLIFENAQNAHVMILASLHQTSFDKPWTAREFGQMLGHPDTTGLIALNRVGTPLGFILVRSIVDEVEILTLCVDPQYRVRKIATRILNSVATTCKIQGIIKIFLEVAEDNLPALGLYQRCGFEKAGQRSGYYRKPGEVAKNAIVMVNSLRKF